MDTITNSIKTLLREENGATAVEYGLIVALIFVACVAGMNSVGESTTEMWTDISDTALAMMG